MIKRSKAIMFTQEDGEKLVKLARVSIETMFTKEKVDYSDYDGFSEKQGVFVTLNKDGELRGCIGFPEPTYALNRAVVEAARSAAFDDPRFPPVSKEEMLTVPKLVKVKDSEEYEDRIIIGKDGLIIRGTFGSGLLLPQVPVDYDWSVKEFLKNLCMKAGLPSDAWKDLKNRIYSFQAQIFEEKVPKGEVMEKEL
ncbi:MAG: TIGR00296 family protein [Candidatus Woesearchaeota archaeon]|nr:TIGR00296 family protein [Candidatus Woesearchaeota archaeon]